MYIVQNLFVGERKELEKAQQNILNKLPIAKANRAYSDILENPLPHFCIIESTEEINPRKYLNLLSGTAIQLFWSAEDSESKIFLRTEGDEAQSLLPGFYLEIAYTDGSVVSSNGINEISNEEQLLSSVSIYLGKRFNSIDEIVAYTDENIKSIQVFKFKTCDVYGNVLQQGDEIVLMYDYINIDSFIKWLNFKLRNDGVYEVTEKNIKPFLKDLEIQMHSSKRIASGFILPCYASRSGQYELYKYELRNINGKDTICL